MGMGNFEGSMGWSFVKYRESAVSCAKVITIEMWFGYGLRWAQRIIYQMGF